MNTVETLGEALARAAHLAAALRPLGISAHTVREAYNTRARLVDRRHELLLASIDERWWAPRRRYRRLAALARVEAALDRLGLPW